MTLTDKINALLAADPACKGYVEPDTVRAIAGLVSERDATIVAWLRTHSGSFRIQSAADEIARLREALGMAKDLLDCIVQTPGNTWYVSADDPEAAAARKMRGRWFGTVTRAQLESARELVNQEAKDHPAASHASMVYGWFVRTAEMFGSDNAFPIMVRFFNDQKMPFGAGEGGILKTPRVSPTEDS